MTAVYNGADARTVETAVTTPLEQAINGVEGMQYMTSTSGNDGTSAITITFDVTRSLDLAAVDIQNRISQAEGRLPNEVKQVGVSVTRVSTNFVLAAAAFAEHGGYDPLFIIREYHATFGELSATVKHALSFLPAAFRSVIHARTPLCASNNLRPRR